MIIVRFHERLWLQRPQHLLLFSEDHISRIPQNDMLEFYFSFTFQFCSFIHVGYYIYYNHIIFCKQYKSYLWLDENVLKLFKNPHSLSYSKISKNMPFKSTFKVSFAIQHTFNLLYIKMQISVSCSFSYFYAIESNGKLLYLLTYRIILLYDVEVSQITLPTYKTTSHRMFVIMTCQIKTLIQHDDAWFDAEIIIV